MASVTPSQALQTLRTNFNLQELELLAFNVGIPYEDLRGSGKSGKALAMVQYSQRHDKFDQLVEEMNAPRDEDIALSPPKAPAGNVIYHIHGDNIQGDKVGGDKVGGDKVGGDKVGGDNIEIGSISDSEDIAVGKESSAKVPTEMVAPPQETKQPPPSEIHIHGNVTGSNIGGGTITSKNIAGGNITIGSKEEFKNQLTELETLIKTIIDNGEIADKRDASDLVNDVNDALAEVKSEDPSASRLERYLYSTSKILESAAQATTAAGKVGVAVLKAAPIAASLVKAASVLF